MVLHVDLLEFNSQNGVLIDLVDQFPQRLLPIFFIVGLYEIDEAFDLFLVGEYLVDENDFIFGDDE